MLDKFPLIFIVNLPARADRRREAAAELSPLKLMPGQAEFFPAIRPEAAAGFPSVGARGCFLSHLAALKEAQRRGVDRVMLLEDDFCISDAEALGALAMPDEWDFLYLGHRLALNEELGLVRTDSPIMTTHAYAAHARVFEKLIAYLEACLTRLPGDPIGGPMHVDGALSMFRAAHAEVVTYAANPSLITQRSSASDVTTHWVDRLPGVGRVLRKLLK